MEKEHRKYAVVMILCFLFGGFSIIMYLMQVYSVFWRNDIVLPLGQGNISFPAPVENFAFRENATNETGNNTTALRRRFPNEEPSVMLSSPNSLMLLLTGIVSLLAGLSLWSLIREKEIRSTKKMIFDSFLLPEEKKVLSEIEKRGGSATQSEISRNTGLSRVKIHRIIKNLEKKNLVKKQPYGMTNRIVLERK